MAASVRKAPASPIPGVKAEKGIHRMSASAVLVAPCSGVAPSRGSTSLVLARAAGVGFVQAFSHFPRDAFRDPPFTRSPQDFAGCASEDRHEDDRGDASAAQGSRCGLEGGSITPAWHLRREARGALILVPHLA